MKIFNKEDFPLHHFTPKPVPINCIKCGVESHNLVKHYEEAHPETKDSQEVTTKE